MSHPVLQELGISHVNSGACIGGLDFLPPQERWIASVNPATGEPIAEVALANADDYEKIMAAAQEAFLSWRKVPAPVRGLLVREMAEELRKHKDALGTLVALENGKIKQEGDGEVQEMIDIADFAVGLSRQLYGLTMPSERPGHRIQEQWHPLGITGIISAFNFPVAVWSWNAFLAAVCGNVSIWKPSQKTPLTAIAVQHICNRVLEDKGYRGIFNLLIGSDQEIANRLVEDPRVPLLSFTGSTRVGRQVAGKVGSRLGRSLLELGGNNALLIDKEANHDMAIRAVVFGAVGTAGQRCTSTRRVIIHEAIYEDIKAKLLKIYSKLNIGDPLEPGTLVGPLIDEAAVAQYHHTIQQAVAEGGTLLCGGKRLVRKGYFVEPAIIAAKNDMPVVQEETFAPILYLIQCHDIEEAISLNNAVAQGLSSAIFTGNHRHAELFLSPSGSDCGIANVNIGTSGAEIGGAFGGEKDTGGGRESGSDSWKAYMRRQTNAINYSTDLPLAQGISFDF